MKIKIMKGEMNMIEVAYQQMGDYQIPQVVLPKTKKWYKGDSQE